MKSEKQRLTTHSGSLGNPDIGDRAGMTKLFDEPRFERAGKFFGIAF
jgi:hypothetical protein